MTHSRLEAYLDEMERPLSALTPEARAEAREEARQHLLSLIAAHEELGSAPEEALETALRQFGHPARLGRKLAHESCRPVPWKSYGAAGARLVGAGIGGAVLFVAASQILFYPLDRAPRLAENPLVTAAASIYVLLGGVAGILFAAAGNRRLTRACAGMCVAGVIGPLSAMLLKALMICVFGSLSVGSIREGVEQLWVIFPAGAVIWALPATFSLRRAVVLTAVTSAAFWLVKLINVLILLRFQDDGAITTLHLVYHLQWMLAWGLQGAVVGGLLATLRAGAERIARGRRGRAAGSGSGFFQIRV